MYATMAKARKWYCGLTLQAVPTFLRDAISDFLLTNPADFNFLLEIKAGDSGNPFGTATCEC